MLRKTLYKHNAVIRTRSHVSVCAWLKILNFEKLECPRDVQLSNWSSATAKPQYSCNWHLEYLHLTWIPGWPLTTWSLTLPLILIIFEKSNFFPTRRVSLFYFFMKSDCWIDSIHNFITDWFMSDQQKIVNSYN